MINDQVFYTKAPLAKGCELSPGNTESCDSQRDLQPITEKETVSTLHNIPTPHSAFREGHHSFAPFPDSRSWAFEPGAIARVRVSTQNNHKTNVKYYTKMQIIMNLFLNFSTLRVHKTLQWACFSLQPSMFT